MNNFYPQQTNRINKLYIKKLFLLISLVMVITGAFGQEIWYAKNSGEWTAGENWTQDPSGNDFINPSNEYPKSGDAVVIAKGLEMSVTGNKQIEIKSLILNGTLKLGTTTGQKIGSLGGSGRLVLEAFNLPTISGDKSFYTALEHGGTVVFEGDNEIILNEIILNINHIFYNVELNRSINNAKIILAADLTVNGNLDIKKGTFQIGNNTTSRTLTLNGDLLVGSDGSLITFKEVQYSGGWPSYRLPSRHDIKLSGNLINNGVVDLTVNGVPVYRAVETNWLGRPTEDYHCNYTTLTINGASNTTLTANGTTNLHRLIIDKDGGNRAYRFTINPSQKEYFRLFGQNNNSTADKALVIKSGTLELTGATYIHSLTEGGDDFYIPKTGGLWINGSAVKVNSTAIDDDADGFTPIGVNANTNGSQSFSVKGLFKITNGVFNTQSHGFVAWDGDDADATVRIEGGEIYSPGFRSASNNTGKWTYDQSGGKVILKGEFKSDLEGSSAATFDIKGSNNVFIMSGGEIEIKYPVTTTTGSIFNRVTTPRAVRIESAESNYNVSGGFIRIERFSNMADQNPQPFLIESTAPFYNLIIGEDKTSSQTNVQLYTPLRVLNDLTVGNKGSLKAINDFDNISGGRNISVGRNFTVKAGGSFEAHGNTFTFDGGQSSIVTNDNSSALSFGNFIVDKDTRFTGGNYSVSFASQGDVEVSKNLKLQRGDFRIGEGKTIALKGNASLYAGSITGEGTLKLNGAQVQVLFSDQGKENSFGNLLVSNKIKLESPALASWLNFGGDYIVDINKHNLELTNSERYNTTGWSAQKIIRTSGLSSDGGLTLPVSSSTGDIQHFPLGIEGGSLAYAQITGGETTSKLGKMTVVPVNGNHPGAVSAGSGLVPFYFKTNLDFSTPVDLQYEFYFPKDVSASYVGLVLNNGEWKESTITLENKNKPTYVKYTSSYLLTGSTDFAVGNRNAVKNPRILYSVITGSWDDENSWSTTIGGSGGVNPPTETDIVYIIDNHVITIGDSLGARAGQLIFKPSDEIQSPKLVIGAGNGPASFIWDKRQGTTAYYYDTGSSFGEVSGRGHIEVQGTTLPSANYTAFLRQEGAVFEYSNGDNMSLPSASVANYSGTGGTKTLSDLNEYPTLLISGAGTKTGANADLLIHENLEVTGANTYFSLSASAKGDIRVNGDVLIHDGGWLQLPGVGARKLTVKGDVVISNGQFVIREGTEGVNHKIYLEGDFSLVNGAVNLNKKAKAEVYFMGVNPSVYSAMNSSAAFYRVHIQKPENVKAQFNGGFTVSEQVQGLLLVSGIAHLNNTGIDILLNSGSADFTIPPTSVLMVTNDAKIKTSDTNSGVLLNGALVVGQGGVANLNQGVNNYVVYSASGKSAITVEGNGELYIGSQLRRSENTEAGILKYSQLGAESIVVVGEKNCGVSTRGMFEILNDGSSFHQAAGAVLTIYNQKSTGAYDLYFDPTTSSFGKGSAIKILSGVASNAFDIYAVKSFQNLIVGKDDGTETAVQLPLLALTLNENLII